MSKNEITIVGIDPGTTTAVSIIDLKGNLIAKKSEKEFSKSEISEFIISKGKPLIIATDVSKPPSLVKKIASTFGSELFSPEEDLSKDLKDELSEGVEFKNSHELDAYVSAFFAFKENKELFDHIKKRLKEEDREEKRDEVFELVVKGSLSIKNALKEIEKAESQPEDREEETGESINWRERSEKLKRKLSENDEKIKNLENYIEELEEENEEVKENLKEYKEKEEEEREKIIEKEEIEKRTELVRRKQKEIERLERELKEMREKFENLKEMIEKLGKDWEKIQVISDEKELEKAESKVAFLEKGIEPEKIGESLEIIISDGKNSKLEDKGIKTLNPKNLEIFKENNICIVKSEDIQKYTENSLTRFKEWIRDYKESRKNGDSR